MNHNHVSMWVSGAAIPSPPTADCFNRSAYFYKDQSECWQEWDSYCLSNWDEDEECLAIELKFKEAIESSVVQKDAQDDHQD